MPNQRGPEKRLVAFWLLPKEIKVLDKLVFEDRVADRAAWFRARVSERTALHRKASPSRRSVV
jgi:hypothetical protein